MSRDSNPCSLTVLLLLVILVISMSNYFTFSKIEYHVISSTDTDSSNIINLYQSESIKELRKKALLTAENDRKMLFNASIKATSQDFYKSVKVEAYCAQKERIGEKGDGGKYVCNPKKVKKDCTLLSLGLNNQIGYDQHIYEATGRQCKILGADLDPQNQQTKDSYAKMNGELFAGRIPNEIAIPQMLEKAGRKEVELLKIDIEGGEVIALEPLIKDYFVCQLLAKWSDSEWEPSRLSLMTNNLEKSNIEMLALQRINSRMGLLFPWTSTADWDQTGKDSELEILEILVLVVMEIRQNYLTTPTATDTSNVIDLYQSETVKELRKKALISAENDRRVLFNASLKTNGQDFYRKMKIEAYCAYMYTEIQCVSYYLNSTEKLTVVETKREEGLIVAFKTGIVLDHCPAYDDMDLVVTIGVDPIPSYLSRAR
ncbi:hypothetical protein GCK72_012495 [Caenorhabditis remanei]|uniref:Methyltransferase FkbM domain-containing protein n=1 Tax=Caenorhabditis remanei TaxID=31234 RepID=A0A6A5GNI5_CAERE|nr:hypothetical protein GCK72_012495 [Caenorhabditis remanei]KAF1756042.1 hypothetical protein GCK72_012495 [Caenorhabditis remanei]